MIFKRQTKYYLILTPNEATLALRALLRFRNKALARGIDPVDINLLRFYVNSWGRAKNEIVLNRVGEKSPARFYVLQNRILFLKLRKLRIPKQTRFSTLVLLLQPSMKPLDQETSIELRISLNQL